MRKDNGMRALASTLIAAALALPAASPAFADWDDDDDWRYRRHHRYDDHHDKYKYKHKHHSYHRSYHDHYVETPAIVHHSVISAPHYYRPPAVYTSQQVVCEPAYDNLLPTVLGGVAGGLAGSGIGSGSGRDAAIIAGALIGGLAGNYYTVADRRCAVQVFETADIGTPVSWQNPEADYAYTVTPVRDYRREGRYCREYNATARIGSRTRETYGTACMQPDGSWEIVD